MCLNDINANIYWILNSMYYVVNAFMLFCVACVFEGKPIPTFPMVLCRRKLFKRIVTKLGSRQLSGLRLDSKLGKALDLLKKYDLDTKKRRDFPVEVELESLLSTSTLMIAAATDMDLASSIEYFLSHCATTEKHQPVEQVLRAGVVSVLDVNEFTKLRSKTKKCLQWAEDPERPSTDGTSLDEAAAIMLYTQQTCLFGRLNKAMREHLHPEKLEPFLPYLKLLLTGLNKLPLVRKQTYRAVTLDLHEQYNLLKDKVFTWWAFSSTTTNLDLLNSTSFNDMGGSHTLFIIDAIGVDISAFSAFPDEEEVLLLPGTSLVVKRGINEANIWKFDVSVVPAAQRHEKKEHPEGTEGRALMDLSQENLSQENLVSNYPYQNIDLPHPGWTSVPQTTKIPVSEHDKI